MSPRSRWTRRTARGRLADRVRRVDGVRSVRADADGTSVRVVSGVTFTDLAARFRPVIGDGSVDLERGSASVEISATAPGPSLLATIDALDHRSTTAHLTSRPSETIAEATDHRPARGEVSLTTDDRQAVAATLAATRDEIADAGTAPRIAFIVWDTNRSLDDVTGWVGLPVGSDEPDDDPDPNPTPGTPTGATPPPWTPVDVTAQTAAIRAFLERSVTAAGVAADVSTGTEQCDLLDPTSTRATATVLVPVFTRYDDAQPAFDRVTALWSGDGLVASGSALGTDGWSRSSGDGGPGATDVASATIRGTTEGLVLTAASTCAR